MAINACITVGGTKEHCQTTTEFSKEAEDLQGIFFKKSLKISIGAIKIGLARTMRRQTAPSDFDG